MFSDVQNESIKKYLSLKKQEKEIEEEIEALKEPVLEALLSTPQGRKTILKGQDGSLTIMVRKKWVYPAIVESIEEELKHVKKEAEQTGAATFTESESLLFRREKMV